MSDDFSIGERLLIYRRRKGYSMKELANITGVSPATISKYESKDYRDYDADTLAGIAAVLNVSINRVVYGMDDPRKDMDIPFLVPEE